MKFLYILGGILVAIAVVIVANIITASLVVLGLKSRFSQFFGDFSTTGNPDTAGESPA